MDKELCLTFPKWRLWVLHFVAKALGVLIHVHARPFGSTRLHKKSIWGQPGVCGGPINIGNPIDAKDSA